MNKTDYLASIIHDNEKMHDFGMKHGFVANYRSFYEDDHVIPDTIYPIQTEYVDGFMDCPSVNGDLADACKAAGINVIEYDGHIYLDTQINRMNILSCNV